MTCIYKIESPRGKVYIGQSRNVYQRISCYKRGNSHSQIKLHNSINKYGWSNHNFEIVCILPKDILQADLDNMEMAFWLFYKEAGFEMLNLREPGKKGKMNNSSKIKMSINSRNKKHSEETKSKMSNSHKGKTVSENTRLKISITRKQRKRGTKSVGQYSLTNDLLNQWESVVEASKNSGVPKSSITQCAIGKTKTGYKFIWKYIK